MATAVDTLRGDVKRQIGALPKPPVVNGLRITLKGTVPLSTTTNGSEPPVRRTLLILTSDVCDGCQAVLPNWRTLIDTLPVTPTDELVVASFRGNALLSELAERAARRGMRSRALQITQQAVFALATGLTTTPTTAVLDEQERIRFFSTNLSPDTLQSLTSTWNSAGATTQLPHAYPSSQ